MTPAEVASLKDRELIAIQLPGAPNGPDVFLAGRCVRPDADKIGFYTTHPGAPVMTCLTLEDAPGQYAFHRAELTLAEAMQDHTFASYFYFAKNHLNLNNDGGHSAYVYTSIALSFNRIKETVPNFNPDWIAQGENHIPPAFHDLIARFVERVAKRHLDFCFQYSVKRVLN